MKNKQIKRDTWSFTDDNGKILTRELGEHLIKCFNIVHIKQTATMSTNVALTTPLYSYNPNYGVYEGLTVNGLEPLHKMIYKMTGDIEISSNKINDTIRYIKANAPTLPFIETNIIAFKNTLYDVEHDTVLQKDPKIVTTTRMTNTVYNPDIVEHSQLDTFMHNLFGGKSDDAEMMRFIYEVIGYCLVNNTFAQKFFILYGEGGNGKSSFLQLLTCLLTEANVSNIALIDIDGNKFRLAEIMGKFANIGDDIDSTSILSTANIKKIVTGDTIMIEQKGCNPYSYKPHAKLFFSCNDIPAIYDTSTGMNDRLVIIPMTNRIRATPIASPTIVNEIVKSGGLTVLLNRALEGLRRLRSQGAFTIPPRVTAITKTYIEENNHVALFIRDIENGEVTKWAISNSPFSDDTLPSVDAVCSADLYTIYTNWSKKNGYRPTSEKAFAKAMRRLGYTKSKKRFNSGNPQQFWKGTR